MPKGIPWPWLISDAQRQILVQKAKQEAVADGKSVTSEMIMMSIRAFEFAGLGQQDGSQTRCPQCRSLVPDSILKTFIRLPSGESGRFCLLCEHKFTELDIA